MTAGVDPVDVAVGDRIRAARLERGMTQSQIAKAAGVTFQQIQKYERGANRVSASMLVRIAKVLDRSLVSLFPDEAADLTGDAQPSLGAVAGGHELTTAFLALSPGNRALVVSLAAALAASESR
jgi:transcriptional regulator with XRE-family HTH domain